MGLLTRSSSFFSSFFFPFPLACCGGGGAGSDGEEEEGPPAPLVSSRGGMAAIDLGCGEVGFTGERSGRGAGEELQRRDGRMTARR